MPVKFRLRFFLALFVFGSAVLSFSAEARVKPKHGRVYAPRPYPRPRPPEDRDLSGLMAALIIHAGIEYYYHKGYFYRKIPTGLVISSPPVGALVQVLPAGYSVFEVNGIKYLYYNDVYYLKTTAGYLVVPDPVYEAKKVGFREKSSFIVNIPNYEGGYTPVVLIESGRGFIGPQGEYYSDFPSVAQLKAMYGR